MNPLIACPVNDLLRWSRRWPGPDCRALLGLSVALMMVMAALLLSPASAGAQPYTIRNLGTLCEPSSECGPAESRAFKINNLGQVVGISHVRTDQEFGIGPFRTGSNLPISPAIDRIKSSGVPLFGYAYDINDSGWVVGSGHQISQCEIDPPCPNVPPLLYQVSYLTQGFLAFPPSGQATFLQDLVTCDPALPDPPFCLDSIAFAVNDAAPFFTVVGSALRPAPHPTYLFHAFSVAPPFPTAVVDLGVLPSGGLNPTSDARGVDDFGNIVGFSGPAFVGPKRAFFSRLGVMNEIGTLGGASCLDCESRAYAITTIPFALIIAGESDTAAGRRHAFRFAIVAPSLDPVWTDLGTLGGPSCPSCSSAAYDINDLGHIVGESATTSDDIAHAFIFRNNVMTDLNDLLTPGAQSQWVLTDARGINDLGQIVGTGIFQGRQRGYVLTPPLQLIVTQVKDAGTIYLADPPPGEGQSLRSLLEAVEASISRGNLGAAGGQLGAYENHVSALMRNGSLTEIHGNKLLAGASLIRLLIDEETRR